MTYTYNLQGCKCKFILIFEWSQVSLISCMIPKNKKEMKNKLNLENIYCISFVIFFYKDNILKIYKYLNLSYFFSNK